MKTLSDIAPIVAKEFGVSEETVKNNFDALLKGLKYRIYEEDIMSFYTPIGKFYHCNRMRTRFKHTLKMKGDIRIKKSLKRRLEITKKNFEAMCEENKDDHPLDSFNKIDYNQIPPLEFYGFRKGYTLKEMEQKQQKVFDLKNKHKYE